MWFGTKKKSEAWSDVTSLYNVQHKSGVKIIVRLKNIFNGLKLNARKKRIHEKVNVLLCIIFMIFKFYSILLNIFKLYLLFIYNYTILLMSMSADYFFSLSNACVIHLANLSSGEPTLYC